MKCRPELQSHRHPALPARQTAPRPKLRRSRECGRSSVLLRDRKRNDARRHDSDLRSWAGGDRASRHRSTTKTFVRVGHTSEVFSARRKRRCAGGRHRLHSCKPNGCECASGVREMQSLRWYCKHLKRGPRVWGCSEAGSKPCWVQWTKIRVEFSGGKGNATCNPFEINILASLALVSTGNGQTVLNDLFSAMNISKRGLHKKTFQKCLKEKINPAAQKAAGTAMSECAGAVKTLYGDLNFGNPGNIAVSYNGTWMTRGHSSHIGVGSVIELLSGYVLDFVVLSNFCLGCEIGPKESDPAYQEWKDTHICQRNSSSKPGQMEVEAATILFERSLAKHGLRYRTMLCDGDSRSCNALQDAKVYGFVEVEKEDCVNHVHKRMGTALRNLVQKQKGEGKTPLGGKGKLTADLITKLTMYYGWALKSHEGDIEKMQKAVMASYYQIDWCEAQPCALPHRGNLVVQAKCCCCQKWNPAKASL